MDQLAERPISVENWYETLTKPAATGQNPEIKRRTQGEYFAAAPVKCLLVSD
jgi:hypothetical protein